MNKKNHRFQTGKEKVVEKLVLNDALHYIHMIFPKGEGLPVHEANADVYMTVVKGTLTLSLDGDERQYDAGTLIEISEKTVMHVHNTSEQAVELIVIKAPAPTH
ncbi:cupin domain-containing protein [Fusibacter sp. JL298sf-3]